jgi:uncharacterized protein with PIN domain
VKVLKFLTDGMLGKLTRWLRMLGHDVEYSKSLDDDQLITMAREEGRVLLTRDLKLYQRATSRGTEAFLVEGKTEDEKLAELARRFNLKLEIDVAMSNCPKCNTRVKIVSKDEVTNQVPSTTYLYYNEFWKCPKCGQIYWQGAHWKRIEATLKKAREILEKQ